MIACHPFLKKTYLVDCLMSWQQLHQKVILNWKMPHGSTEALD